MTSRGVSSGGGAPLRPLRARIRVGRRCRLDDHRGGYGDPSTMLTMHRNRPEAGGSEALLREVHPANLEAEPEPKAA
jgi:hypothetical protein